MRPTSTAKHHPNAASKDRARTLAHILSATLDKIPGLREALPRLHDLELALRERGLVALNEAPLPTMEQIQQQIANLAPDETPAMLDARARLLSSLDRRTKPRRKTLPTFVCDDMVFSGEATLSQFMEEVSREAEG